MVPGAMWTLSSTRRCTGSTASTRGVFLSRSEILRLWNSRTGFMITAALRRQHHDADKLGSEEPGAVQKAFTRSRNDISTQTATRYLQTKGQ